MTTHFSPASTCSAACIDAGSCDGGGRESRGDQDARCEGRSAGQLAVKTTARVGAGVSHVRDVSRGLPFPTVRHESGMGPRPRHHEEVGVDSVSVGRNHLLGLFRQFHGVEGHILDEG